MTCCHYFLNQLLRSVTQWSAGNCRRWSLINSIWKFCPKLGCFAKRKRFVFCSPHYFPSYLMYFLMRPILLWMQSGFLTKGILIGLQPFRHIAMCYCGRVAKPRISIGHFLLIPKHSLVTEWNWLFICYVFELVGSCC